MRCNAFAFNRTVAVALFFVVRWRLYDDSSVYRFVLVVGAEGKIENIFLMCRVLIFLCEFVEMFCLVKVFHH